MRTASLCVLAAALLLSGCSGDDADPPTGATTPTASTTEPTPPPTSTAPEATPSTQPSTGPAPQPSAAVAQPGCDQDAATRQTCTFVASVLGSGAPALSPQEQELAARVTDLPRAPWGLSGCDLVGDVTVECQVLFSPPREQEVVATFVLQPVDGGYAVVDYLGAL